MYKFYHADRNASLSEGQTIDLDENGLSRFGATYWPVISQGDISQMNEAELREYYLEQIKKEKLFCNYTSRLQSMFGANSIEEAKYFAKSIQPPPSHPIPIVEIYADKFWSLDMSWLDLNCSIEKSIVNYRSYWRAEIMQHRPSVGERNPPRLEVLIALPAKVGRIVDFIDP